MNLLLLDQFSDPGGAQQNLLELLPAVRKMGWHTLVGLPGEGEIFERVRALGFEAERIACGPYASGRKSAADFGRFLAALENQFPHLRVVNLSLDLNPSPAPEDQETIAFKLDLITLVKTNPS